MTDERYTPQIGVWLKGREVPPIDSAETARQVGARLPQHEQRRRWWPFHPPDRIDPAMSDRPQSQPDPVEVAHQRVPPFHGRTRTMFSPAKAVATGALVFALGGLLFAIQPSGRQDASPPAAATGVVAAPAFFSGEVASTMGWTEISEPTTERRDDEVVVSIGEGYSFPWSTSDQRISGEATVITTEMDYRFAPDAVAPTGEVGIVREGLLRITNDDGAWEGPITILQFGNPYWEHASGWLDGSAAYEGLAAYVVLENNEAVHGHISSEALPPVPALPPAE